MALTRYNKHSHRAGSVFPFGPSIPTPVPSPSDVERIDRAVLDAQKADGRSAQFAGDDTTFVQFGLLRPVRFDVNLTSVAVWQFTVPPGRVLVVDRVQMGLSEPMFYANGQFAWRLTVNRRQLPFHGSQGLTSGRTDVVPMPFGGTEPDSWMSPVYVQANATVAMELVEILLTDTVFFTPFAEYLVAWCWVFGVLKKTTGVS